MSRMNDFLARAYDTNGASRESDMEKAAQAMLLSKLAQDENVDLSGLTEDQLALLAQEVAAQVASQQGQGGMPGAEGGMPGGMPGMGAPPMGGMPGMGGPPMGAPPMGGAPKPPGAGGGPAQANIQPAGGGAPPPGGAPGGEGGFSEEQVKVAQAKMAEADFLGRMMAHAMVQEMGRIKTANEGSPVFGMPPTGSVPPNPEKSEDDEDEEEKVEKSAMAYLAARGYSMTKAASAEGPLTRAIRALGGRVG
jgi:hypothetical protein